MSRDWEAEIARFFDGVMRMSRFIPKLSTQEEQGQMEGKKAVFIIKGVKSRYAFEVRGTQILPLEDLTGVSTYCYARDPQRFLEYCDQVFQDGNTAAFERALQRGDLVMRGRHSIHDRILWRRAFQRLADARRAYAR